MTMGREPRQTKRISIPLDFEEALSDLLEVEPPPKPPKASWLKPRAVR